MTLEPPAPSNVTPPPLPSERRHTPPPAPLPLDALADPAFDGWPGEEEPPPKKMGYLPLLIVLGVLLILGLIAYVVHTVYSVFRGVSGIFETLTPFSMLNDEFALMATEDQANPPTAEALTKRYLTKTRQKAILDGWGEPIQITISSNPDGGYTLKLLSMGADKIAGTDDDLWMTCDQENNVLEGNITDQIDTHFESVFESLE